MLFTFPAETESSQMDFGNFLSAEPRGAGVRLLWVRGPKGAWPLRPPAASCFPTGSFPEPGA